MYKFFNEHTYFRMKVVDSINASAQNFESVMATSKATRSAAAQRGALLGVRHATEKQTRHSP